MSTESSIKTKSETMDVEVQCDIGSDKMVDAPLAADSLRYSAIFHPVPKADPASKTTKVSEGIQATPFYVSPFNELRKMPISKQKGNQAYI
ncbi:hypothetical protein Mgra_00001208 [Meloidogyne graminicola]|uniref:Uncharacterized protein n=1 Tax=Meloidogyne graminicola TaxID=189291 RepID=A0A8T0A1P6_9BILA|nr:hypothetical protein Mgra_00001208 [Meloidogyne graminicola]